MNLFNLEIYSAHLQLWPASFCVFGRWLLLIICLHVTVKCGEWKETWWRRRRSPTDVHRGVNLNWASRFDYDSAVNGSRCILRSRHFHTSNAGCCSSETHFKPFLPPSQSQRWLSSLCSPQNIRTHVPLSFPQFWSHQIVWVWLPEVWSHQIILIQWGSMTDSWCSKCCEIRLAKLVSKYNDKSVTCWGLWAAQDEARCQQIYWKLLLFLSDRNLLTFRLKLHRFVFKSWQQELFVSGGRSLSQIIKSFSDRRPLLWVNLGFLWRLESNPSPRLHHLCSAHHGARIVFCPKLWNSSISNLPAAGVNIKMSQHDGIYVRWETSEQLRQSLPVTTHSTNRGY